METLPNAFAPWYYMHGFALIEIGVGILILFVRRSAKCFGTILDLVVNLFTLFSLCVILYPCMLDAANTQADIQRARFRPKTKTD